jgi:predicted nucleotidyltransferase
VVKYTKRVYTVSEIRDIVAPIARARKVEKLSLIGSYARNEATWTSNVDLMIDFDRVDPLFDLGGLQADLEEGLKKPVDIVKTPALDDEFYEQIMRDAIEIYG